MTTKFAKLSASLTKIFNAEGNEAQSTEGLIHTHINKLMAKINSKREKYKTDKLLLALLDELHKQLAETQKDEDMKHRFSGTLHLLITYKEIFSRLVKSHDLSRLTKILRLLNEELDEIDFTILGLKKSSSDRLAKCYLSQIIDIFKQGDFFDYIPKKITHLWVLPLYRILLEEQPAPINKAEEFKTTLNNYFEDQLRPLSVDRRSIPAKVRTRLLKEKCRMLYAIGTAHEKDLMNRYYRDQSNKEQTVAFGLLIQKINKKIEKKKFLNVTYNRLETFLFGKYDVAAKNIFANLKKDDNNLLSMDNSGFDLFVSLCDIYKHQKPLFQFLRAFDSISGATLKVIDNIINIQLHDLFVFDDFDNLIQYFHHLPHQSTLVEKLMSRLLMNYDRYTEVQKIRLMYELSLKEKKLGPNKKLTELMNQFAKESGSHRYNETYDFMHTTYPKLIEIRNNNLEKMTWPWNQEKIEKFMVKLPSMESKGFTKKVNSNQKVATTLHEQQNVCEAVYNSGCNVSRSLASTLQDLFEKRNPNQSFIEVVPPPKEARAEYYRQLALTVVEPSRTTVELDGKSYETDKLWQGTVTRDEIEQVQQKIFIDKQAEKLTRQLAIILKSNNAKLFYGRLHSKLSAALLAFGNTSVLENKIIPGFDSTNNRDITKDYLALTLSSSVAEAFSECFTRQLTLLLHGKFAVKSQGSSSTITHLDDIDSDSIPLLTDYISERFFKVIGDFIRNDEKLYFEKAVEKCLLLMVTNPEDYEPSGKKLSPEEKWHQKLSFRNKVREHYLKTLDVIKRKKVNAIHPQDFLCNSVLLNEYKLWLSRHPQTDEFRDEENRRDNQNTRQKNPILQMMLKQARKTLDSLKINTSNEPELRANKISSSAMVVEEELSDEKSLADLELALGTFEKESSDHSDQNADVARAHELLNLIFNKAKAAGFDQQKADFVNRVLSTLNNEVPLPLPIAHQQHNKHKMPNYILHFRALVFREKYFSDQMGLLLHLCTNKYYELFKNDVEFFDLLVKYYSRFNENLFLSLNGCVENITKDNFTQKMFSFITILTEKEYVKRVRLFSMLIPHLDKIQQVFASKQSEISKEDYNLIKGAFMLPIQRLIQTKMELEDVIKNYKNELKIENDELECVIPLLSYYTDYLNQTHHGIETDWVLSKNDESQQVSLSIGHATHFKPESRHVSPFKVPEDPLKQLDSAFDLNEGDCLVNVK